VSRRAWPQRIGDILDAIAEIRGFVSGVSFEEFAANPEKLKAVLADFAIIGEAASHVPDEVQAAHPAIEWRRMRDMRNVIVHVYFALNPRIVWDTIQNDLPSLEVSLRRVLDGATGA
jgi:uncharacterized protein with HEPN domain